MTPSQTLVVLRELRALERLEASITRTIATLDASYEWTCVLKAIDDRLRFDRYCLSLEDPATIAGAERLLEADAAAAPRPEPVPAALPDPPIGRLVVH